MNTFFYEFCFLLICMKKYILLLLLMIVFMCSSSFASLEDTGNDEKITGGKNDAVDGDLSQDIYVGNSYPKYPELKSKSRDFPEKNQGVVESIFYYLEFGKDPVDDSKFSIYVPKGAKSIEFSLNSNQPAIVYMSIDKPPLKSGSSHLKYRTIEDLEQSERISSFSQGGGEKRMLLTDYKVDTSDWGSGKWIYLELEGDSLKAVPSAYSVRYTIDTDSLEYSSKDSSQDSSEDSTKRYSEKKKLENKNSGCLGSYPGSNHVFGGYGDSYIIGPNDDSSKEWTYYHNKPEDFIKDTSCAWGCINNLVDVGNNLCGCREEDGMVLYRNTCLEKSEARKLSRQKMIDRCEQKGSLSGILLKKVCEIKGGNWNADLCECEITQKQTDIYNAKRRAGILSYLYYDCVDTVNNPFLPMMQKSACSMLDGVWDRDLCKCNAVEVQDDGSLASFNVKIYHNGQERKKNIYMPGDSIKVIGENFYGKVLMTLSVVGFKDFANDYSGPYSGNAVLFADDSYSDVMSEHTADIAFCVDSNYDSVMDNNRNGRCDENDDSYVGEFEVFFADKNTCGGIFDLIGEEVSVVDGGDDKVKFDDDFELSENSDCPIGTATLSGFDLDYVANEDGTIFISPADEDEFDIDKWIVEYKDGELVVLEEVKKVMCEVKLDGEMKEFAVGDVEYIDEEKNILTGTCTDEGEWINVDAKKSCSMPKNKCDNRKYVEHGKEGYYCTSGDEALVAVCRDGSWEEIAHHKGCQLVPDKTLVSAIPMAISVTCDEVVENIEDIKCEWKGKMYNYYETIKGVVDPVTKMTYDGRCTGDNGHGWTIIEEYEPCFIPAGYIPKSDTDVPYGERGYYQVTKNTPKYTAVCGDGGEWGIAKEVEN
mgnify:CR=1 FL=1